MSLTDELSGLPGGSGLAETLRVVDSAAPTEAEDLAENWRATGSRCADAMPALWRAWRENTASWAGLSAEVGERFCGRIVAAGDELNRASTSAAAALDRAATAVAQARNFARSRSEWLLSWVRSQDALYPNVAHEARDSAISAVANHIADEVRSVLTTTKRELTDAVVTLHEATDAAVTFSELKPVRRRHGGQGWENRKATAEDPPGGEREDSRRETASGGRAPGRGTSSPVEWGILETWSDPAGDGGASGDTDSGSSAGVDTASGPPVTVPPLPGEVDDWIAEALRILAEHGVDVSAIDPEDIATIIHHESGGDPYAQNNWDSNAMSGHPSMGIMQTIPQTFEAYKLAGYDDIWNPVHNIIAAVRYALDRYGSIDNVPGLVALENGQGYVGY
ncbi:transglycosylase SLT domain-containing protein [Saccharomonospora glauca]|jgi:hypothetical protein|uniref:Transglycosylase family protein n=1 Tax=Saccharomonospora glauca K62 TaxID=928724 RepID=I1D2Y9_9PSEU|nr:transglycosylase SLT domain-containing protein [Saccharomonospora glauca]EIE99313.1 transglycosylase family protein [Saccharomonospora glauca K62]